MTSSPEPRHSSHDLSFDGDAVERQFEIVTIDYERTTALIESVVRTRMALRAAVVAAYLGVLAFAVEQDSTVGAIVAAVATILAAAGDLYLGWVYHETLRRANKLERLFQHRMRVLDRAYDPFPARRMRAELEQYEFGVYASFPRFRVGRLAPSVGRSVIVGYATLLATAIIAAVAV